jgi:ubiquinone/menaquinone biosynthesis C-methylase UbiE
LGTDLGKQIIVQDFRGLDRQQWHLRYEAQAQWTRHIRQHIFNTIKPQPDAQILEVGSGTGAVLGALLTEGYRHLNGLDIDHPSLTFARSAHHAFNLVQGDGHHLPFQQGSFHITCCHYLLLWTENPPQILQEMRRVTRTGGWVIALAEPDHQARLDFPPPLDELGKQQTRALADQGVDVLMGRKLRGLFYETGLRDVEVGILAAQWQREDHPGMDETEWMMVQADMDGLVGSQELAKYQQLDRIARQEGQRILFIPTFYGFGKVP